MLTISPKMKSILPFNALLFLGAVTFLTSLFLPKKLQGLILKITQAVPVLGNKLTKTFKQVWTIGEDKMAILKSVGLSMVLQFLNVFLFWIITRPFLEIEIPVGQLFTFIPIGLISVAIPVSPAGLGVGHLIFDELFKLVNVTGGASLFNLYFVITVGTNLLGSIAYLTAKKHSLDEASEFEEEAETSTN